MFNKIPLVVACSYILSISFVTIQTFKSTQTKITSKQVGLENKEFIHVNVYA